MIGRDDVKVCITLLKYNNILPVSSMTIATYWISFTMSRSFNPAEIYNRLGLLIIRVLAK